MPRRAPRPSASTAPRTAPPIPVRALDFVMYNTRQMRKTRAFYQRLFGWEPGEEWDGFWSEFATAPLTFCLNGPSKSPDPKWDWHGSPCLALAVDDVPAAVAECKRRRVPVLIEPVETRVCWMAWIADPDGNRICLHSRKNGTAG